MRNHGVEEAGRARAAAMAAATMLVRALVEVALLVLESASERLHKEGEVEAWHDGASRPDQ